jgi:hypothetical protein
MKTLAEYIELIEKRIDLEDQSFMKKEESGCQDAAADSDESSDSSTSFTQ